jgi:general secretion pathway protein D
MWHHIRIAALICALGMASELPAAEQVTNSKNLDVSARQLAFELGKKLHKHVVIDPRTNIMIDAGDISQTDMTYAQLLSVLCAHELTISETKDQLLLIPIASSRSYPSPIVQWDNIRTPDDQLINVVVPVATQDAPALVAVLRPLMPQYANLAMSPDRNALIFFDRSANIRRVIDILTTLEKLPVKVK